MTEAEATLAGLTEIWVSTGSKKQNALAHEIVDRLRSQGVEAEVIDVENRIGKKKAVWRDKNFEKRLRYEPF